MASEAAPSLLLQLLPDELICNVVSFLHDGCDVSRFSMSCKRLAIICSDETIWKALCFSRSQTKAFRLDLVDGDWRVYYKRFLKNIKPMNKIVMLSLDGDVFVCDPDGSNRQELARGGPGNPITYQQPTWSNNGCFISLSTVRRTRTGSIFTQQRYDMHSNRLIDDIRCKMPVFYTLWHPDDTRVTMLSNWPPNGLGCTSIDYTKEQCSQQLIQLGVPYYYTHGPIEKSELVLTHINQTELHLLDISTRIEIEGHKPSKYFNAPTWTQQNKAIVVVMSDEDPSEHHLIMFDMPDLDSAVKLTKAPATSRNPNGIFRLLMGLIKSTDDDDEDDESSEPTEFLSIAVPRSAITIIDTFSIVKSRKAHDFVVSSDGNHVAYRKDGVMCVARLSGQNGPEVVLQAEFQTAQFWCFSPNSRLLLMLHVDGASDKPLFWQTYDLVSKQAIRFDSFATCEYFLEVYLPFQTQYWKSISLFSPDSSVRLIPLSRTPKQTCFVQVEKSLNPNSE